MTALDRAFIKAYRDEQKTQSPAAEPAHHPATVVPMPHARRFFERAGAVKPNLTPVGEEPIVVEPTPVKTMVMHELQLDISQDVSTPHAASLDQPTVTTALPKSPAAAQAPAARLAMAEAIAPQWATPPAETDSAPVAPLAHPGVIKSRQLAAVEPNVEAATTATSFDGENLVAPANIELKLPRLVFPRRDSSAVPPGKWPASSLPNPFALKGKPLASLESGVTQVAASPAEPVVTRLTLTAGENADASSLQDTFNAVADDDDTYKTLPAILPLSAFRSEPVVTPFRAALEVDHFLWPTECEKLFKKAQQSFDAFVKPMQQASKQGQKCLAITSCRIGEGRTTFTLTAARHLAARGMRVVLLDADFARPILAARLGLAVDSGWEAIIAGEAQVADVLIESLTDRLSLLPLAGPLDVAAFTANLRGATMLGVLKQHFDVVLLDCCAAEGAGRLALDALVSSGQLDAALTLRDVRRTSLIEVREIQLRLHAAEIRCLGMAENFCAP